MFILIQVKNSFKPHIKIVMSHVFQVDIVMRYDESRLDDFTGLLIVDASSNRFLNLTLINGRGTIHGMVTGFNSSQAIQVSLISIIFIVIQVNGRSSRGGLVRKVVSFSFSKFCTFCKRWIKSRSGYGVTIVRT